MLVQIVITYDDLLNTGAFPNNCITTQAITANQSSYNNPSTVLVPVNLYGGKYNGKIASFQINSGAVNTTSYEFNSQLINITSSKMLLPANGSKMLQFTNTGVNSIPDVSGDRKFIIEGITGNMDFQISISQFGNFAGGVGAVVAPWTIDKTQTWATAQFSYLILCLDLEEIDEKATFGEYNKKTFQ